MKDDAPKPPGSPDQGATGEEKTRHGPDEPRHTVTYSRRRFVVMLGGFNDLVGPLVGVVAAALFAGDPLYLIWGPRVSTERVNSRLESISAPN